MKIHNPCDNSALHPELQLILNQYRQKRNFNPQDYLIAKAKLIHDYFEQWSIGGVVFGLSGGVDSAVVLAIFEYISRSEQNPIVQSVVPALLPYLTIIEGVSGQSDGLNRALNYVDTFNNPAVFAYKSDLTKPLLSMLNEFQDSNFGKADAWERGQLATNLRTPAFYHLANIMTQKSFVLHIVSGTTNLDEAAYIGYFAKVGDAMVDIQPISDLHKSEVYTLAKYLNVSQEILDITPRGDVYDNRTDLEMIGTDYDFVELHYYLSNSPNYNSYINQLSSAALAQYQELEARLDKLHKLNKHKYQKPSSVITFEIMNNSFIEVCSNDVIYPPQLTMDTNLLNAFIPYKFYGLTSGIIPNFGYQDNTKYNEDVISNNDCQKLIKYFESVPMIPVSNNGYQDTDIKSDIKPNFNYSIKDSALRSTCYNTDLAQTLFERLKDKITQYIIVDSDYAQFLSMPKGVYTAVGVNPLMRYIKYLEGGALVPHYDTEHNFQDNKHITLQSAIFNLTSQSNSGLTRFINDPNIGLSYNNNPFKDWSKLANSSDVITEYSAKKGSCLTFDHRTLHDSSAFYAGKNEFKAVIRTDIIYKFVGN